MQHVITPYGGAVASYATWDNLFSAAELDALEAMATNASVSPTVGDATGSRSDTEIRRSKVRWLYASEHSDVFQHLGDIAGLLNARHWGLDLTGFGEALQLTRYEAADAGHYDWHQDYGAIASRKLSLVVQLSDPSAYEGGELQLKTGAGQQSVEKARGRIVAFPSWQLHRVTPVTAGARHTLVAWISGPRFR